MTKLGADADWAVWLCVGAWQGGEVVDGVRHPMTGRHAKRGGAVKALKWEIEKLGCDVPRRVRTEVGL